MTVTSEGTCACSRGARSTLQTIIRDKRDEKLAKPCLFFVACDTRLTKLKQEMPTEIFVPHK